MIQDIEIFTLPMGRHTLCEIARSPKEYLDADILQRTAASALIYLGKHEGEPYAPI